MNIWLKTENLRQIKARQSFSSSSAASIVPIQNPLPVIVETERNDEILSNSSISVEVREKNKQFAKVSEYSERKQVAVQCRQNYHNFAQISSENKPIHKSQIMIERWDDFIGLSEIQKPREVNGKNNIRGLNHQRINFWLAGSSSSQNRKTSESFSSNNGRQTPIWKHDEIGNEMQIKRNIDQRKVQRNIFSSNQDSSISSKASRNYQLKSGKIEKRVSFNQGESSVRGILRKPDSLQRKYQQRSNNLLRQQNSVEKLYQSQVAQEQAISRFNIQNYLQIQKPAKDEKRQRVQLNGMQAIPNSSRFFHLCESSLLDHNEDQKQQQLKFEEQQIERVPKCNIFRQNNLKKLGNQSYGWKGYVDSISYLKGVSSSERTPKILETAKNLDSALKEFQASKIHGQLNSKRLLTTGRNHNDRRQYIVSLIQYCSNQVGIAAFHINTGQIHLTQIIQRMSYIKTISTLQRFYPQQLIFSASLQNTFLIKKLMSVFRRTSFRPVKRNLFDETKGYYIYTLRGNKSQYNPDHKFLSFAALNALLITMQLSFQFNLTYSALSIKWHYLEEVLVIDSQTIADLQIFINKQTKVTKNSFIENFKCLTDGGIRMLRANILQPVTDINIINQRLDLVEQLLKLENKGAYQVLTKEFLKFKNYEIITAKFIQNPKCENIKSIKSYLNAILVLSRMCFELQILSKKMESISNSQSTNEGGRKLRDNVIFRSLLQKLGDKRLAQMRSLIEEYFDSEILKNYQSLGSRPNEANQKNNKRNISKPQRSNRDSFIFLFKLDKIGDQFAEISRLTYSHTIEDILKVFQHIKHKTPPQWQLKLLYNQYRGYYLSGKPLKSQNNLNLDRLSDCIQDDVIQIGRKNNNVTFSTSILISLNNRLKQNQNKLIFQSTELLLTVIKEIQKNLQVLFEINSSLSQLDMIFAFVDFINTYKTTHHLAFSRPSVNYHNKLLKIGKLRTIWTMEKFNKLSSQLSISFEQGTTSLVIHKQINSFEQLNILYSMGYLTILTQIGCFVPAGYYSGPIFQTLISKIQVEGNLENKMSHFQTQLLSLANILDNAQREEKQLENPHKQIRKGKCLILIDQICKGTKPDEEYALSLATIEELTECRGQTSENISVILVSDYHLFKMLGRFNKVCLCEFRQFELGQDQTQAKSLKEREEELKKCMERYNFSKNFERIYESLPNISLF